MCHAERIKSDVPGNILAIRLSSIGDVLFTLPAVNALQRQFPGWRMDYLSHAEYRPLLEGFGALNQTFGIDQSAFRSKHPWRIVREILRLARQIRRERYRLVVDLHGFGETALLTRLTGAPERWGCVYRKLRGLAYTRRVSRTAACHPVENHLQLLAACGVDTSQAPNEYRLPVRHRERARAWLAGVGINPDRPFILIQPFTSTPHKDWPLEKLTAFARHWRANDLAVIFGGGPADRERLAQTLGSEFPISAGMDLMTSAGVAAHAGLVLGADTGLLHLATALGRRVLMLIHSTLPGHAYPYGHPDWAVTPPPRQHVPDIAVEAVVAAARDALNATLPVSSAAISAPGAR